MEREFSKSNPSLSARDLAIIASAVIGGAAIFLLASALIDSIGFPLDDSWIHLTYARNLAVHGEWAFQLGHPSAGSTAPLWTFLLALGFWLDLTPYVWTYLLGNLTLIGLCVFGEKTARIIVPTYRPRYPWVGIFLAAEWHLLWAAMSGMETLLHALLIFAVIAGLMTGSRRYLTLGLLTGLSIWVRPDGLTLVGPVVVTILFVEKTLKEKSRAWVVYFIGFGSLFVPYLLFNLWLSGTPMPNTFYAKQAEYAVWQSQPILYRLTVLLVQLFTGPSIVLLPGILGFVYLAIRRRAWPMMAALLWCGGYLLLYILRLPAYQHGRYLMPAMPVFFMFGLLSYLEFQRSFLFGRYHWPIKTVWQSSLSLLTVGFVLLGARSYGEDVGLIQSEMVVTAKWVAANLPPGSIVAAHDIGALGYFDDHQLIDLAGLVSPEVIPFMRDEARLAQFLDQRGANYLVAFPAFYPELTGTLPVVFTSGGKFAPAIGQKNMSVYLWEAGNGNGKVATNKSGGR
jgi:hypothetical protein